jgi:hypothetical protein
MFFSGLSLISSLCFWVVVDGCQSYQIKVWVGCGLGFLPLAGLIKGCMIFISNWWFQPGLKAPFIKGYVPVSLEILVQIDGYYN